MSQKQPDLMFRYAKGLGDAVACFLHSKYVGWLTHAITGTDKPCEMCSHRRQALNILFPIPFWRLFFEDEKELHGDLYLEYKEQGYNVTKNDETQMIFASKSFIEENEEEKPPEGFFENKLEKYTLVNESETDYDGLLIKVQVFKENVYGNRNN